MPRAKSGSQNYGLEHWRRLWHTRLLRLRLLKNIWRRPSNRSKTSPSRPSKELREQKPSRISIRSQWNRRRLDRKDSHLSVSAPVWGLWPNSKHRKNRGHHNKSSFEGDIA